MRTIWGICLSLMLMVPACQQSSPPAATEAEGGADAEKVGESGGDKKAEDNSKTANSNTTAAAEGKSAVDDANTVVGKVAETAAPAVNAAADVKAKLMKTLKGRYDMLTAEGHKIQQMAKHHKHHQSKKMQHMFTKKWMVLKQKMTDAQDKLMAFNNAVANGDTAAQTAAEQALKSAEAEIARIKASLSH